MKTSNLIPHRLSHIVSWKFWKRIRGFIRGFCSVQTLPPLVSSGKRGVVDFPDSNVHHTHWALVGDSIFLYLFFTQALHLGQPRGPMITLSWSNTWALPLSTRLPLTSSSRSYSRPSFRGTWSCALAPARPSLLLSTERSSLRPSALLKGCTYLR
jgi:hypothetical protein